MSVSTTDGIVILDGRTDARDLVNSKSFKQVQWLLYVNGLWHKVTIFDGWRYGKDYALKMILAAVAPNEMLPIMYQKDGIDATFYVCDSGSAIMKLCATNLKIFNPTGRKLVLQIELRFPLTTTICVRSIIGKTVAARMYNSSEKMLNFSRFHKDPELDKWMYCPLTLKRVAEEVNAATCSYLRTLRVLVMSNNFLTSLHGFNYIAQYAPNLRVFDVQNNLLPDLSSLGRFGGLQLYEITLDGNPLCELYEDESKYINEVRTLFPNLVKLDGIVLPHPGMLVSKSHYVCSTDGEMFVEQFIPHYYKLYDGWNGHRTRLNLIGTYHKDALYSLSAASPPSGFPTPPTTGRLNKYFTESRNLLKMSDYIRSNKYLHHGRDDIVKFLIELPLTEHDRGSIHVDLTHYTETCAIMNVHGIFRELNTPENPLRSFNRVFIFYRNNNNFSIVNDMFFITSCTIDQSEFSLNSLPPVPSKPSSDNVCQPSLDDKNYEIKQNMVEELAKATEMNLRWSRKCLDETEWDFQEALIIFMELYKEGTIPPEAFKI